MCVRGGWDDISSVTLPAELADISEKFDTAVQHWQAWNWSEQQVRDYCEKQLVVSDAANIRWRRSTESSTGFQRMVNLGRWEDAAPELFSSEPPPEQQDTYSQQQDQHAQQQDPYGPQQQSQYGQGPQTIPAGDGQTLPYVDAVPESADDEDGSSSNLAMLGKLWGSPRGKIILIAVGAVGLILVALVVLRGLGGGAGTSDTVSGQAPVAAGTDLSSVDLCPDYGWVAADLGFENHPQRDPILCMMNRGAMLGITDPGSGETRFWPDTPLRADRFRQSLGRSYYLLHALVTLEPDKSPYLSVCGDYDCSAPAAEWDGQAEDHRLARVGGPADRGVSESEALESLLRLSMLLGLVTHDTETGFSNPKERLASAGVATPNPDSVGGEISHGTWAVWLNNLWNLDYPPAQTNPVYLPAFSSADTEVTVPVPEPVEEPAVTVPVEVTATPPSEFLEEQVAAWADVSGTEELHTLTESVADPGDPVDYEYKIRDLAQVYELMEIQTEVWGGAVRLVASPADAPDTVWRVATVRFVEVEEGQWVPAEVPVFESPAT